jgi:hypothetical protein
MSEKASKLFLLLDLLASSEQESVTTHKGEIDAGQLTLPVDPLVCVRCAPRSLLHKIAQT